jgi:hypothetical protein
MAGPTNPQAETHWRSDASVAYAILRLTLGEHLPSRRGPHRAWPSRICPRPRQADGGDDPSAVGCVRVRLDANTAERRNGT